MRKRPRRQTRQRRVILEMLQETREHPTAVRVFEQVRREIPTISLGTVYRNLELLVRMGLVRRLEWGGAEAHFDADTNHHYHVRCVQCGRVDDLPGHGADSGLGELEQTGGYVILGHRLEFDGLCPNCQNANERSVVHVESENPGCI